MLLCFHVIYSIFTFSSIFFFFQQGSAILERRKKEFLFGLFSFSVKNSWYFYNETIHLKVTKQQVST